MGVAVALRPLCGVACFGGAIPALLVLLVLQPVAGYEAPLQSRAQHAEALAHADALEAHKPRRQIASRTRRTRLRAAEEEMAAASPADPNNLSENAPVVLAILSAVLGLFAALAADMGNGASTVQPTDDSLHVWVVDHTAAHQRQGYAAVSNSLDDGAKAAASMVALSLVLAGGSAPSSASAAAATPSGQMAPDQRSSAERDGNGSMIVGVLAALTLPAGLWAVEALCDFVKKSIQRVRPSDILHSYSFPSSHTSRFAFCVALAACVLAPRLFPREKTCPKVVSWSGCFFFSWLVMGAARVLTDAHWLSDTAAGAALGTSVACCMEILVLVVAVGLSQAPDGTSKRAR
eukprot:TRINITY_DN29079_c0_g1_i1.p1 TRINITY_DN29079_c0_g1~~TRINITY_DN29079_c0_g1_i1.p1  ORF type:complete len:367 (-),score=43.52 TRINITY_DN29079_c0_g1_i1:558-1601(-)